MADVVTSDRQVPTPFRLDPFLPFGAFCCEAVESSCELRSQRVAGSNRGPGDPRWSPPPMVWGWKYLHSMQRFLAAFGGFVIFDKIVKMAPKPLHGMGVGGHFGFLSKMVKTRCMSDCN